MNKRIKELAEQAGFTTNEANMTVGNYRDGNEYFYAEDFIEDELKKFAELIVKECAKSANEWYQNHDKIHSDPMSYVLAHFGVEQ